MSVKGGEVTCFPLISPETGAFLVSLEIKGKRKEYIPFQICAVMQRNGIKLFIKGSE